MITVTQILTLEQVDSDLDSGELWYETQSPGVGNYFRDSLIADMESLSLFAGTHRKQFGLFRMLSKRFPFSIYYTIQDNTVIVIAVLAQRRNPMWIKRQITGRME